MSDRTKSLLATGSSSNDYLSVLHELTIGQFRGCEFSGGLFRSDSTDSIQTIGQHGQESALHVLICLLNEFRVTSLASSLVYRQPERVVSVPYLALIAFWGEYCRIVVQLQVVCYSENLAKGAPRLS